MGAQTQCQSPQHATSDQNKATAAKPPISKSDMSKLICYHCGKAGHIASNAKCLQYRKPEQQQLFAAQVIDDRLEGEQPDQTEALESQGDDDPSIKESLKNEANVPPEIIPDDCLNGSQYDNELPYKEFNSYEPPSNYDEPVYIRAMSTKGEVNVSSAPALFDNINWQTCRDALKWLYQQAPYLPNNSWEFTPHDDITLHANQTFPLKKR